MIAFKVGKENTIYINTNHILLAKAHHDDPRRTVIFLGFKDKHSFTVEGSAEEVARRIDAAAGVSRG